MSVADWAFVVDVVHRLRDMLELSVEEVGLLLKSIAVEFLMSDSCLENFQSAVEKSDLSWGRKCTIREILPGIVGNVSR